MSEESIYRVQSVERALLILENIAKHKNGIRVGDLAESLNLKLPTVHRLASYLEFKGYLEQDEETKKYFIGLKVLELQGFLMNRFQLVDNALPDLRILNQELRETTHLAVLSDGNVVYVESLEGIGSVISKMGIGKRTNIHSTSLGKVLVAWESWEDVEKILQQRGMERKTKNTIVTLEEFKEELQLVRKNGYALDLNEQSMISCCIAVPVWNHRNEVEGAISISIPTYDYGEKNKELIISKLKTTAGNISRKIGYTGSFASK